MFRVHGAYGLKPGREIYLFDEGTQRIIRTYLDLRYRLLPYTYSMTWQVTSNGGTLMRPLVMDFPDDPQALSIGDQFLFGSAILVAPVTTANATTRSVYLPACGADWHDFWTGTPAPGGKRVEAAAPIETLPLFIRAGSILPTGPLLQYSSEKPADPLEIRIYPGANGSFTLYEDEGDSYRYEKGSYSTIAFIWNDATKTLSVGARKGDFPGMLKQRLFKIVLVKPSHGVGVAPTESPDRSINYDGTAVDVAIGG
jgi:alpha-D-xyloside xylohydrolase